MVDRNRITDVPGLRVGHADDPRLGSGVTAIVFDRAGGRGDRRARRRPGHARGRPARPRHDGRAHRRHRAVRRLRLRARCGVGRAGVARRARARLCHPLGPRADRAGGDPVRSARTAATRSGAAIRPTASSATRRQPRPATDFRARQRRRRPRRHHRQLQGRARLGLGGDAATGFTVGALAAVNAAGSAVIGDGPWFWAAPFERDGEFGGRGFPVARCRTRRCAFRTKGAPRRKHDARRRRDRCAPDQGAGDAARHHGAGRPGARDSPGAHAARRRRGVRRRDRRAAAGRSRSSSLAELGTVAADVLARAIARAVYEATALPFPGALPAWRDRFGR